MKATLLRIRNMKGTTRDVPLSGLDVLVGPNGSGKTTIQQALALAVIGYVPGQGEKPAAIMQLASADHMMAGLDLDNGFRFERVFERSRKRAKDGSISIVDSQSITLSPSGGESGVKARDARIQDVLGRFIPAFDLSKWFEVSDTERRNLCLTLVPGEIDRDFARRYLRDALLTDALKQNDAVGYEITSSLIDECLQEWRAGLNAQAGILAMQGWASAQQTIWNKRERDAVGAVRELSEIQAKRSETERGLAENEAKRDRLQTELVDAERDLAVTQERENAASQRATRIHALGVTIERLRGELAACDAEAFQAQRAALVAQIRPVPEVDEREGELDALAARREDAQRRRNAAADRVSTLRAAVAQTQKTLRQIQQGIPTCVIDARVSCPKDWTKVGATLAPVADKEQAELADAEAALAEIDRELEAVETDRKAVTAEVRIAREGARTISEANAEIQKSIVKVDEAAAKAETERQRIDRELAAAEAEKRSLAAHVEGLTLPIDAVQARCAGLKAQIEELKATIVEQRKQRDAYIVMQQSLNSANTAEVTAACVRALVGAVGPNALAGVALKQGLGALAHEITHSLRAMGIQRDAAIITESAQGHEIFDIGWTDGANVRPYGALSTGERALLVTAMVVAFLQRAKVPLRVVTLDNAENLDPDNLQRLMSGLHDLYMAGMIDNAVLSGVLSEEAVKHPGWTVHALSGVGVGVA